MPLNVYLVCVRVYVHLCAYLHVVTVHVWRSEDNLREPVLSLHCTGSGDRGTSSGTRRGSKHLHPLRQLTCPRYKFSVVKSVNIYFLRPM